MLTWQGTGPAADVGAPNVDDGVLPVGLEHHHRVPRRRRRHHRQVVQPDAGAAERAGHEAPVGVVADLPDEVGRVGELGGARRLVGALAASQRLAGPRRQRLALARQPLDLHVDVGVRGTHHHHRRRRRAPGEASDSETAGAVAEGEGLGWGKCAERGSRDGVRSLVSLWCWN